MKGRNIDYGAWKDGSSIFKNNKGYYIINIDEKGEEYNKYLKNWKPKGDDEPLYLDKTRKKWVTRNPKLNKSKNKTKNKTKRANRPSPPYPANDYCKKTKKGNDGNMYVSTKNKHGVCRWVKLK